MADRAVSELIAFEGPSKSGKTTLAKALSLALRIPKWEPVRVSKHTPTEEEVERFKYRTKAFPYFVLDELSLLRHIPLIIVDRHPVVSEIVYSRYKNRPSPIAEHAAEWLSWCRENFDTHLIYIKKPDAPEYPFYRRVMWSVCKYFDVHYIKWEDDFVTKLVDVIEWVRSRL